jgi:hypothetical protein
MRTMNENIPRPCLLVARTEARRMLMDQVSKASDLVHADISNNDAAEEWYESTCGMLRQVFSSNDPVDEFTGRHPDSVYDEDLRVAKYARRLSSIVSRLELYPEAIGAHSSDNTHVWLQNLEGLLSRFHLVARQLRYRHNSRSTLDISDEYDVQDLLHALLRLYFDDIRAEEWTPSYAGGSSRMDFLLKAERTVIEVKKTRAQLGAREVGEQLAIDIMRYKAHPDCGTLICFIYDPDERVQNPHGLERDLSQAVGEMDVRVYITQR